MVLGGQYLGMYAWIPEGSIVPPTPTSPEECTCEEITVTYLVMAEAQCAVLVESGQRCP